MLRVRRLVPVVLVVLFSLVLGAGVCVVRRWVPPLRALRYLGEPKVLVMPVQGLEPASLVSTWNAPRSGGRRHQGADLFARRGTAVVSAVRGLVLKVGHDRLGGKVVTVLGEGPALYYYAHLDAHADGLHVGRDVLPGSVLGTVGNTGNARTTPPHLHFGVYRLSWTGARAVDPVPLLKAHSTSSRW